MATSKRILSITIKRINDDSPDTSWLGEYSDTKTSEFSIDRRHSADCASVNPANSEAVEQLERVFAYLDKERIAHANDDEPSLPLPKLDTILSIFEQIVQSQELIESLQESLIECDCDESGDMSRGEYRYFNPSFNYVDKSGKLAEGNTAEDVRKYVAQDYARMEKINSGDVGFLCIAAVAEVQLGSNVVQTVTSGYVCGVESDGDYWKEVGAEQLHELRSELTAMGFSKRAIATAVKDVDYEK